MNLRNGFDSALRLLAFVLMISSFTLGQIQNGQFQGTVLDQSGAAVANATVTATNEGTSQKFTATTTNSGFYVLPQLPIGQYRVTVEAQGFKNVSAANQTVNAGVVQRLDFKLTVGQRAEVVEVTDVATQVNTEDSKLANTVGATQIANLPLNGRNVYDLIQLAPGAVNTRGVSTEGSAGPNTVSASVNGQRQTFNGFTINGVSNKGLSGSAINQPIQDTVQEFQELTLNMSAQYGNSAGSITNLVTKSGTNAFHGSLFEFLRNDIFDANDFFLNQAGEDKPPLRFNQFGGTFGGPLRRDKLFFFAAFQADRFRTSSVPSPIQVEGPEWRSAIEAALPGSVSALLYSNFAPRLQGGFSSACGPNGDLPCTLENYIAGGVSGFGFATFADYLCADNTSPQIAAQFAQLFGVTSEDQAAMAGCSSIPAVQAGLVRRDIPLLYDTVSIFSQQDNTPLGNLFNGNEASFRLDYNWNDRNRLFSQFNWLRQTDEFGPGLPGSSRGFFNPIKNTFPNFQLNYIRTFSPSLLNEFRLGYTGNVQLTGTNIRGVPFIAYDSGEMGFGSYNGYPQMFKENIYSYSDIVSISKGTHNLKIGADVRRNLENSEFDVSRPSYYFFDPLFFTIDQPYLVAAGVDPGLVESAANPTGPHPASLATNIRHWRNVELGAFFQDDWKVNRRLTLNLGIRYDLYQRHSELNDLATTFLKGPGTHVIDDISSGRGWLQQANTPFGLPDCDSPANLNNSIVAGACGDGGFAAARTLGNGDHNNWGPRAGFAWDLFGDGKSSLRGGFGVAFEGTLYNPLSNSRWNPPYYSFNQAINFLGGDIGTIIYGPQSGGPARFDGPPDPANGQGPGANNIGNISGWSNANQNMAFLTGIVLPEGIRDPYVYNYFLGIQHELLPKLVMELNYVGTAGHKLFRAENINRIPGGRLPEGTCAVDNLGRQLCSQVDSTVNPVTGKPVNAVGRLNPNYGTLRNWLNVVNSNYNALQGSLRMQAARGVTFNLNYTWSHSIDNGSTWHSGATTSNAGAAGEGYTLDQTRPDLDRGNSVFDVRHRLVAHYVWELPWFRNSGNGFARNVLGGWQFNGIWSFQTGAHWSPFCSRSASQGCDFNLDGGNNDRPDAAASNVDVTHDQWANGFGSTFRLGAPGSGQFFTTPCTGCIGNLGRNTFVGPNFWGADLSVFKNINITESVNLQFRAEGFNVFNRANFLLPGANAAVFNTVTNSRFGKAGGAFNPRQMQFGLRLSF